MSEQQLIVVDVKDCSYSEWFSDRLDVQGILYFLSISIFIYTSKYYHNRHNCVIAAAMTVFMSKFILEFQARLSL